jgi:hypothetical protein
VGIAGAGGGVGTGGEALEAMRVSLGRPPEVGGEILLGLVVIQVAVNGVKTLICGKSFGVEEGSRVVAVLAAAPFAEDGGGVAGGFEDLGEEMDDVQRRRNISRAPRARPTRARVPGSGIATRAKE